MVIYLGVISAKQELLPTMSGGNFATIPLTILLKSTGAVVKETYMLLRIINNSDSNLVHVIGACEEGVFDTHLSQLKIKRAKTKGDLLDEKWLGITSVLFTGDFLSNEELPKEFENILFAGKLTSLEQYDEVTGDLIGDELAEEVPEFELIICSKGILLVTYGTFQLPLRATDELSGVERQDYDVLQWVRWQTEQIRELKRRYFQADKYALEHKHIAAIKEDEIQDMTKDYRVIIRDLEDRFYQVLESKKRKIRELEGEDRSDLELLNLEYKKRNAQNLNHVNIEDIVLGDVQKEIDKPQRKRVKKTRKEEKEMEEIKEEETDEEVEMEYDKNEDNPNEESEAEDEESEANEDESDNDNDNHDDNEIEEVNEQQDIDPQTSPEVKAEQNSHVRDDVSDATMYSESEDKASADAASTEYESDEGTETKDVTGSKDFNDDQDQDQDQDQDTDYGSD